MADDSAPAAPPIGGSPASAPGQNVGANVQAMQMAGALLKQMAMVSAITGPHTPLGTAINKAIGDIVKHVPPGASNEQAEQVLLQKQLLAHQQMAQHRAAMQQGAGGPPGGQPAGQPQPQPQAAPQMAA